jgi:hypothetical protein
MTSHQAPRTLVPLILTGLLVAGCGSGRKAQVYVPETKAPVENAVVQAGAPVVPIVSRPVDKAPTVLGQAAQQPTDTGPAEREAKVKRELHEERVRAEHARKRAAAREAALRTWLAQARAEAKQEADTANERPATKPSGNDSPIGASDVSEVSQAELNRRSDGEARAATLRFHELLDNHDARACDLLTPRLLRTYYGEADPLAKCRATVEAITAPVSVTIVRSYAQGGRATQEVVSRIGDSEQAQILRLVLVSGTWLLDAVDRKPAA